MLAAPGVPAGPQAVPPLPWPHGGVPRGLKLSPPQPGCLCSLRLFLTATISAFTPKTRPFSWKHSIFSLQCGEGRHEGVFIFFQMEDDGPIWKRKGMWWFCHYLAATSWANPLNSLCWVHLTIKHPRTSQQYSENNCNFRFSRINCSNREERYDLLMISSALSVFHKPRFHQERQRMPWLWSFSLQCKW